MIEILRNKIVVCILSLYSVRFHAICALALLIGIYVKVL